MAQPANDDCGNAIAISGISTPQTISVDLTGATESLDASCETASNTNRDVWYSFTMPFNGKIMISGVNALYKVSVFDSCGGAEIICMFGTGFIDSLSAGATLVLRFSTYGNVNTSSFTIQAIRTRRE